MMEQILATAEQQSPMIQLSQFEHGEGNHSDMMLDDLPIRRHHSATSRIDSFFEASSADAFMDDAHNQLESLHREVFAMAKQSRARSAVPLKSIQRTRMQKAAITEMEGDTNLARFEIDVTGRHVKALTGRQPGTNRRQIADLMHRLRDADAIGAYAWRQGMRILADIDDQIADLTDKIDKRMTAVDHDDRMPRSKASQKRAHYLALLDDRLDKSRRWNNQLRTQNAALRQDIDDLNLERRTDLAILARLGESVIGQRAAIGSLLDGIRQAELGQAASLMTLGPLDAQYRAETQKFIADWARTTELDERHRALEEEIIRMKGEMYFGEGDETTPDESIQLIMSRTAWRLAKDKALLMAASARHEQLRALIDQLQRLTGTSSIDAIVARFERADTDHVGQYTTLQALIVELADLQSSSSEPPVSLPLSSDRGRDSVAIIVPDPKPLLPEQVRELEREAATMRYTFSSMTSLIVAMLQQLREAGVSQCSLAVFDRLRTVGVTAQNVESVVSALEQDIRRLLARYYPDQIGSSNKRPLTTTWIDPGLIDDQLTIMVPSIHHDDDDNDFR